MIQQLMYVDRNISSTLLRCLVLGLLQLKHHFWHPLLSRDWVILLGIMELFQELFQRDAFGRLTISRKASDHVKKYMWRAMPFPWKIKNMRKISSAQPFADPSSHACTTMLASLSLTVKTERTVVSLDNFMLIVSPSV